jgi:hypothetical protein
LAVNLPLIETAATRVSTWQFRRVEEKLFPLERVKLEDGVQFIVHARKDLLFGENVRL